MGAGRNEINARPGRWFDVAGAGWIRMNERTGPVEILGVAEYMKDFWRHVMGFGARQQRAAFAGLRIGFGCVGEGEHVHRIKNIQMLLGIPRSLPEAVIERAAPGSSHFVDDSIEDAIPFLVLIKALVQKMAQEAPALRDAPAICKARPVKWIGRRAGFQKSDQVPSARQSATQHAWLVRAIDDVINAARPKSAFERDDRLIHEAAFSSSNEERLDEPQIADGH